MIKLISAEKGFGKTKILLEAANEESKENKVIFLAYDTSLRFQISSRVRLIENCVEEISNFDCMLGFIKGVSLGNYETKLIIIDSVLRYPKNYKEEDLARFVEALDEFSKKSNIDFMLSVSKKPEDLPEAIKSYI